MAGKGKGKRSRKRSVEGNGAIEKPIIKKQNPDQGTVSGPASRIQKRRSAPAYRIQTRRSSAILAQNATLSSSPDSPVKSIPTKPRRVLKRIRNEKPSSSREDAMVKSEAFASRSPSDQDLMTNAQPASTTSPPKHITTDLGSSCAMREDRPVENSDMCISVGSISQQPSGHVVTNTPTASKPFIPQDNDEVPIAVDTGVQNSDMSISLESTSHRDPLIDATAASPRSLGPQEHTTPNPTTHPRESADLLGGIGKDAPDLNDTGGQSSDRTISVESTLPARSDKDIQDQNETKVQASDRTVSVESTSQHSRRDLVTDVLDSSSKSPEPQEHTTSNPTPNPRDEPGHAEPISQCQSPQEEAQQLRRSHSINMTEFAQKFQDNLDGDPDEVESEPNPTMETVFGHTVTREIAPLLRRIFEKHGDITSEVMVESPDFVTCFLGKIYSIIQELNEKTLNDITSIDLDRMLLVVRDCEKVKINVGWLREKMKSIYEKKVQMMDLAKHYLILKDSRVKHISCMEEREKVLESRSVELYELQQKVSEAGKEVMEEKRMVEKIERLMQEVKFTVASFQHGSLVEGLL